MKIELYKCGDFRFDLEIGKEGENLIASIFKGKKIEIKNSKILARHVEAQMACISRIFGIPRKDRK